MNKKGALTEAFVLLLLISVAAGTRFANLVSANPYGQAVYRGESVPPAGTFPPGISISSPSDRRTFNMNTISLNFTMSYRSNYYAMSTLYINGISIPGIFYQGDWQQNATYIDLKNIRVLPNPLENCIILTDVPDGNRNISVWATEIGYYHPDYFNYYSFHLSGSSSVSFVVDTVSPSISAANMKNKVYNSTDVPLNFTMNEKTAKIVYSIDGQGNNTYTENMTVAGLSEGQHHLTVYAWDIAGNVGASETIHFTVHNKTESQQTGFLGSNLPTEYGYAIIAMIGAAIVATPLLVYLRNNKRANAVSEKTVVDAKA
jgi:hypothetical protein